MSLPKNLYTIYRALSNCTAVTTQVINDQTLLEFQTLVNQAQPNAADVEGNTQRAFTKSLYYSNPIGFMHYITMTRNRVAALVLWTESKRIVRLDRKSTRLNSSH